MLEVNIDTFTATILNVKIWYFVIYDIVFLIISIETPDEENHI